MATKKPERQSSRKLNGSGKRLMWEAMLAIAPANVRNRRQHPPAYASQLTREHAEALVAEYQNWRGAR